MASKSSQPNQSLIDGITTLQALASSPSPVGGRELARQLGFEPTRVNRLLKTLAYLGIARQTSNRKYTAGSGMHVLAAQSLFASGLIKVALPVLEDLRKYNFTVALGVLWRTNVCYLYHAPVGTSSYEALGRLGLYPATLGGIGVSLLAAKSDEYIAEQYGEMDDIPGFSGGFEQLMDRLNQTREDGYCRLEVKPEQHTVAVNVGYPAHAAIGMSGWIPEANTVPLVEKLMEAAATINEAEESGYQFVAEALEDNKSVGRSQV